MEKYQKEVHDLQIKIHGQFATIEFNNMNEKFYNELEKAGIDFDDYEKVYKKLSDFYSEGYRANADIKEETDNHFVKEVVADMKRLMEIDRKLKEKKIDRFEVKLEIKDLYVKATVKDTETDKTETLFGEAFSGDAKGYGERMAEEIINKIKAKEAKVEIVEYTVE